MKRSKKKLEHTLAITERVQVARGQLLEDTLAGQGILCQHTSSTKHCQTAVLELLGSLLVEVILLLVAQRVKAKIASLLALAGHERVHLDGTNGQEDLDNGLRSLSRELVEGLDGVGAVREDGVRKREDCLSPDTKASKHAHAAMLQLSSSPPLKGLVGSVSRKAKRIPETGRLQDTLKAGNITRGSSSLDGGRRSGGGGSLLRSGLLGRGRSSLLGRGGLLGRGSRGRSSGGGSRLLLDLENILHDVHFGGGLVGHAIHRLGRSESGHTSHAKGGHHKSRSLHSVKIV
mmetsp:Transcript_38837/g.50845  ORF Transcript_38837/g.50845 Transcript_38837/m.50845 type:complete len:289 (-) Transcript_38837:17-883(-)